MLYFSTQMILLKTVGIPGHTKGCIKVKITQFSFPHFVILLQNECAPMHKPRKFATFPLKMLELFPQLKRNFPSLELLRQRHLKVQLLLFVTILEVF